MEKRIAHLLDKQAIIESNANLGQDEPAAAWPKKPVTIRMPPDAPGPLQTLRM